MLHYTQTQTYSSTVSDIYNRKDKIELMESKTLHVSQYMQCDKFLVQFCF